MSNKNTIKKKKIHRDCYDLDWAWILWLKERLPVYLHDADKIVDLDFEKFTYKDKEYTLKEMVCLLISKLNRIKYVETWVGDESSLPPTRKEIHEIWELISYYLWW